MPAPRVFFAAECTLLASVRTAQALCKSLPPADLPQLAIRGLTSFLSLSVGMNCRLVSRRIVEKPRLLSALQKEVIKNEQQEAG